MPPPGRAPAAAVRAAPSPQDLLRQEQALRERLARDPANAQAWQQLGAALAGQRRHAEAAEAFARAVEHGAAASAVAMPWAIALSEAGRHEDAIAVVEPVQARRPKEFALANLLGVLLKRAGRLDQAVPVLEAAKKLDPRSISPWQNLGNVQDLRGDYPAAAAAFEGALRIDPRNAELWRLRARALRAAGDLASAAAAAEKAATLAPRDAAAATLLVHLLLDLGEIAKAEQAVARARAAVPDSRTVAVMEARLLRRSGRIAEAIAALGQVIAAEPGHLEANLLLAALHGDGDRRAANEALRRAVAAHPGDWVAGENLANSLSRSRYDDEAAHLAAAYEVACGLVERHPDRLAAMSRTLRTIFRQCLDTARFEATGTLSRLLPVWLAGGRHSDVHYELGSVESLDDRIALVEWHRGWGRRAAAKIRPVERPAAPAVQAGRRIRVGFMSSDLRNHPVSYFALQLLELYDRTRFEVFCYSFNEKERDKVQAYIEGRVDAFRWWPRRPDEQVAAGIAADRLDILFELGGSTAMNKLEVMAYRPARLGASWLGYPHSAGLEAIDLIVTDPYIRPADPRLLIERPLEMPESWVSLGRLGFTDEPITPGLPEERRGALTFGTANNTYKMTARCLDAWAAVLRAVPGSRFLFLRPEAKVPAFVANARSAFAARDVDRDRLDFVGIRGAHLPHYNSIDIALDSLPHVGGTTTCEALWMGVPTVTLVGPGFPERLAYSNLANAGLEDLAAFSLEDYVAKAAALAEDRARRQMLRAELRSMIRARPLGDVPRFVQNFYGKVEEAART